MISTIQVIKAIELLKKAYKSSGEAIIINPHDNLLKETDRLIREAIIILTTERYTDQNNKDCMNCSNSFSLKGNRLICMTKWMSM
jgi:hypothetical protein